MIAIAKLFGAAALAIGAALVPIPALSSLIASTEVKCAQNEYVVGLTGRTGLWIDAVAPICARWDDRTFQPVPGRAKQPVGGKGGGANQQSCPPGSAISSWQVDSILQSDNAFADSISVQCRTLAPPHDPSSAGFRLGGQNNLRRPAGGPKKGQCPAGQLVTSISVWKSLDGRFVTAVKMECDRAPSTSSWMRSQNGPNGTVTYFSPELKVHSGDSVQLDACREWGTNCGALAADAFCALMGKGPPISYAAKPNVGLTVIISDRRICNQPGCTGFASIECGSR